MKEVAEDENRNQTGQGKQKLYPWWKENHSIKGVFFWSEKRWICGSDGTKRIREIYFS